MKKEYMKPYVGEIALITTEKITTETSDWVDGETGVESSIF